MRILVDYHHADLFESWQLLFGDRFGWQVFAPYGMEWFDAGYWAFERAYHGDAVARQYLDGVWDVIEERIDHIARLDGTHPGRMIRGVTLEQARRQPWDIVIASVPDNEAGFARLAREVGATYGVQIGNQWQHTDWTAAAFGLVSATLGYTPPKPYVVYRQPFSLADFRYEPPPRGERFVVSSFVQCLAQTPESYERVLGYARALTDEGFDFRIYGSYGDRQPDEFAAGNLPSTPAVAAAMRASDVIWHDKFWSDGYGHVIHNAFAVGRPVIGAAWYYADKLAGPLWVDGETSWDLGRHHPDDETMALLRRLRDNETEHRAWCERSAARFREIVNFDREAAAIYALLTSVRARVAA